MNLNRMSARDFCKKGEVTCVKCGKTEPMIVYNLGHGDLPSTACIKCRLTGARWLQSSEDISPCVNCLAFGFHPNQAMFKSDNGKCDYSLAEFYCEKTITGDEVPEKIFEKFVEFFE